MSKKYNVKCGIEIEISETKKGEKTTKIFIERTTIILLLAIIVFLATGDNGIFAMASSFLAAK